MTLTSILLMQPLKAAERLVTNDSNGFKRIQEGKSCPILVDNKEYKGVLRAVSNLQADAQAVTAVNKEITN